MSIFDRLREKAAQWLAALRKKGLAGIEAESEEEPPLEELLPEQAQRIRDRLESLPLPAELLKDEIAAIDDAIARWLAKPHSQANALAILGNSVEEIARIVGTGLEKQQHEANISVRILQWSERPLDLHALESRLVTQLGRGLSLNEELAPEIVLIPNLSWCFLRSADGLDGIEYLCRAMARERDRFWIIGCGRLAWSYLNLIVKIAAYVCEPYILPALDSQQLQTWLAPLIEEFDIHFDGERNLPLKDAEQSQDFQQQYFKDLAELSEDSIAIARELFARSLRSDQAQSETPFLFADKLKLPNISTLSADAQYLIYSILLHDRIDLTHLAESLGDSETNVQSLLQTLKASELVVESGNLFQVNPLHYSSLRDVLDSNHFLLTDE